MSCSLVRVEALHIHIYPPLHPSGGTHFPDSTVHLSAQPVSFNKVSFLPVTPVIQLVILESVLRARTL
jgi:hypothetical protein